MEIRRVRADEGQMWHDLRLRMVTDSPDAFGQSVAEVQAMPAEMWTSDVTNLATSAWAAGIVAEEDGLVCGTASLFRSPAPVLPREHVAILARAYNAATPDANDEEILGPALAPLARDMARAPGTGGKDQLPLMFRARLSFIDMLRVAMCACGPRDPALTGWDPDSLFLPTNENAVMRYVWVDPARRGKGVGMALMDAADAWARSCGVRRICLIVVETQVAAVKLYLKTGYQLSNNRMRIDASHAAWDFVMAKDV